MRRYNRAPSVPSEPDIPGDELENDRQALESNLQQTDLSLRLSSASDDDPYHHQHDYDSVEYPRHYHFPTTQDLPAFHRERTFDHIDDDEEEHIMNLTYRTEEDYEGVNPYGGETMSTAGHHASALTLSAGLGGRGARRDVSLSGAEYDPDRPLHDMITGVDRLSMFDMDPSRSKHTNVNSVMVDPLVVDDTEELDRILESGRNLPSSMHPRMGSPMLSSSSASGTDSGQSSQAGAQNRPKLTDALRRVSFSPKRPRSPQVRRSAAAQQQPPVSPLARSSRLPDSSSMNMPTPRPARRQPGNQTPRPAPTAQPELRFQPATPSSVSSKFTRMARGIKGEIKGEIEAEQRRNAQETPFRPSSAPAATGGDTLFQESYVNNSRSFLRNPTPRRANARGTPRGKVQLPDVTGLTSAVESPAKFGADYYRYPGDDRPRESEARLLQTLATVQSKLQHLEDENSISRRRVHELEMELEECKREVARERTRLLEREDIIVQQQQDLSSANARAKSKGKARETTIREEKDEDVLEKYREAVEQKKALEALISGLRSHLARLTTELSSHRELLAELRRMRDSDARSLKQKGEEIMRLKNEVERLAGEVEVLRGVVEEGLKERRSTREVSMHQHVADTGMSQDMGEGEEEQVQVPDPAQARQEEHGRQEEETEDSEDETEEDSEEELEPFDPTSIQGSSRGPIVVDRTMRTDHATQGSSLNLAESTPRRVLRSEDYNRIAADVEERRSNRSFSNKSVSDLSQSRSRTQSPDPTHNPSGHGVIIEDVNDEEGQYHQERVESPTPLSSSQRNRIQMQNSRSRDSPPQRPPAPTPGHASRPPRKPQPELNTPFPQIRGEQLERLFFSAPEHNVRTCTVCNRRRRQATEDEPVSPSWFPKEHKKRQGSEDEDEDEGFEDGSEEVEHDVRRGKRKEVAFSNEPQTWKKAGEKEGIPPQTVVVRVIRELEDDFTHYKGIYVELADQYKEMDAASDVARRNILAQHLREVVDILEQKGDQIAALYDLLSFKDKPTAESVVPSRPQPGPSSWGRSTSRKVPS